MAPATAYITRTHLSTSPPPSVPGSPGSLPSSNSSPIRQTLTSCVANRHGGLDSKQPQRYGVRMPSELHSNQPHWLSGFRSALRLLIIILSAAVAGTLVHTLEIWRSNISLDLRKGELPMTWPARTNIWPTLILFAIAASNFFASGAIMIMSFRKSFKRPIRSRDAYRIVAGSFGVILWACALIVFHLIDKTSKASLGRYACMNRNVMSNGRFQYRAVCSEQGLAFYLAVGAASAELLTLLTLAISAKESSRIPPIHKDDEKALYGRYP